MFVSDVSQRMRVGIDAGRQGAGAEATEATAPVRRRGRAPVQADGVLFQRGSLVRGKGRHDMFRQTADPRAGRKVVFEGKNFDDGKNCFLIVQHKNNTMLPNLHTSKTLFRIHATKMYTLFLKDF